MKINPINNNYNQLNQSFKGTVSPKVAERLNHIALTEAKNYAKSLPKEAIVDRNILNGIKGKVDNILAILKEKAEPMHKDSAIDVMFDEIQDKTLHTWRLICTNSKLNTFQELFSLGRGGCYIGTNYDSLVKIENNAKNIVPKKVEKELVRNAMYFKRTENKINEFVNETNLSDEYKALKKDYKEYLSPEMNKVKKKDNSEVVEEINDSIIDELFNLNNN